ncbi:MAG: hypothetical protein KC503_30115 [Myxococcales bacterium]|nr:hypothetical protein [Myxococcales bacterium]
MTASRRPRSRRGRLLRGQPLCSLAICLALLGLAREARAQLAAPGVNARLSTYATGRVLPGATERARFLRFIQLVDLDGRPNLAGLSVHASFWAAVDVGNERLEIDRGSGDISSLYLRYVAPAKPRFGWMRGITLTVGRQFVSAGPTTLEQIDGVELRYTHVNSGIQLVAFGGAPSGIRLTNQPFALGNDDYDYGESWVVGGRLGYVDFGGIVRGGVAYVQRRWNGEIAQQDVSADLSLSLLRGSAPLTLNAIGTMSLEALDLKEVRASLDFQPFRRLDLALGYRYSRPDLWIPRTSIFSVFSDETFQEASADVGLRITRGLRLRAGYGRRFYWSIGLTPVGNDPTVAYENQADGANRAMAELSWRFLIRRWGGGSGRVIARVERLEAPEDNAYNRARLAAAIPFILRAPIRIVADVDAFFLDNEINGTRYGLLARGFVEIAPFCPCFKILVGGGGGISPLLSKQGTFLVRLSWQQSTFKAAAGRLSLSRRIEEGRW